MKLSGRYFDGKSSAARDVELELSDEGLRASGENLSLSFLQAELRISRRVGNTTRRIHFPNGGVCEVADNDAIDLWLKNDAVGVERWVHGLEHRWRYALAALLIVGVGVWAVIRYGIPVAAERVARAIPTEVDDRIGRETLALLDKTVFTASNLPVEKRQEIRAEFMRIVSELPDARRYELEFRLGQELGANALALPSGIVVITDELILLAANTDEIVAVLAHEVGHVANRHALRMLLQSSAGALVMFCLLGDLSSISSLASGVPAMLLHARYSRTLESEADAYSYAWLRQHNIAAHHFGDILQRLEKEHGGDDSAALSYFASHPATEERAAAADK